MVTNHEQAKVNANLAIRSINTTLPNINNPETHLYKSHDHQTTKKSISNRIPNLIMAARIKDKTFLFSPQASCFTAEVSDPE